MKNVFLAAALTAVVSVCACPFSCKMSEQGVSVVKEDYESPKIESFSVTGESSLRMVFSGDVAVSDCALKPFIQLEDTTVEKSDDGTGVCICDFTFADTFTAGTEYCFAGEATDSVGNTLTFSYPFTGFNKKIPNLIISEVHPKYGSSTVKGEKVYGEEFIELCAMTAGNLAGLELLSVNDGENRAYALPALEVAAGEVIIVHMRQYGETWANEMGDDLSLSVSKYSVNGVRDLWVDGTKASLGDEEDVILLRNRNDGAVLDALCYAPQGSTAWKKDAYAQAAALAVEAGAWETVDISGALESNGMAITRSFLRTRTEKGIASWVLSKSSGETPGTVDFAD